MRPPDLKADGLAADHPEVTDVRHPFPLGFRPRKSGLPVVIPQESRGRNGTFRRGGIRRGGRAVEIS
jgi:hypothetical protein